MVARFFLRSSACSYLQIYWALLVLAGYGGSTMLTAGQRSSLYKEGPGSNPPFEEIRDKIDNGYNGTRINVNNALVEGGMYGGMGFQRPLRLHTLSNSNAAPDVRRWSRWYQTDGKTQIFRLFPGEENVRNNRPLAGRIEVFDQVHGWNYNDGGTWHDWVARITVVKPIRAIIFQAKDYDADDWSVQLLMNAEGRISVNHRRPMPGQNKTETLIERATGQPFDIRVRDNGRDYEVYFGSNLSRPIASGCYIRNDEPGDTSMTRFRWGLYANNVILSEGMIFISHASVDPENLRIAASDLLVGWDTWKSASAAASVTFGAATGLAKASAGNWGESLEAASRDGTFGSLGGASTLVDAFSTGTHIGSTTASGSYDFTITAGVNGLVLTQFSFDAQRKRAGSPFRWSVQTIAGAISTGVTVGSGSLERRILASSGPSDHQDFDLDLTKLVDHVLEPGESATLRITFSGGTVTNKDQKTYLDNVGIFGSIVPVSTKSTLVVNG